MTVTPPRDATRHGSAWANGWPAAQRQSAPRAGEHFGVGRPPPAAGTTTGPVDPEAERRAERGLEEARWQLVRGAVVDRLWKFNAHHNTHTWLSRDDRLPVAAHGVAFFFRQPARNGNGFELRTATRLVLADASVERPEVMLFELAEVARAYRAGGGLEVRVQMANRCESMSPFATYLGVGLSTLDTPAGTWTQVRTTAAGPLDVPGRGYALLTDGTAVLLERRQRRDLEPVAVHTNHPLVGPQGLSIGYRWLPSLTDEHTGPGTGILWHRLIELHHVIWEATHAR